MRWSLWPCLALLLAACGGAPTAPAPAPVAATFTSARAASSPPQVTLSAPVAAGSTPVTSPAALPQAGIRTVFLIVMENHNWSQIKGSPSAPYINGILLPAASHAEQYYNPPGIHPNLPNYLWLEAGTNFGIADDNAPSANHQGTGSHLVAQLERAGISWKSFQEGIDGTTCPLVSNYPYAPKHNPQVYFDDVTGGNDPRSASCIAHVRPYGELAADLAGNAVARYNFITPDLCHDMHDACRPANDPIKQGDDWLSTAVPTILRSPAYQQGGALFITWDEGEGGDGPIGLLALAPSAKGHGYQNTIHYTHSSLLATLQRIFGVGPPLGDAVNAADLGDLFATWPPRVTTVQAPSALRSPGARARGARPAGARCYQRQPLTTASSSSGHALSAAPYTGEWRGRDRTGRPAGHSDGRRASAAEATAT